MTRESDIARAFFLESGSEQLHRIYLWARARYAAPWAVFGAVLLRVAASVGPHVQLPGLIGGRASLNLLCAFVSASGGGKGVSDKVARLAWPTSVLELPIGSGEGIAATFARPSQPDADREPVSAAIFSVPEIDTLAGIAARQGSILLAQLKSMAMGEQLGQSNASKATTRIVAAHSYRCCLSVGAQPGHTGVLFDDTTGGTPQRFLWFPTTDPLMPSERLPDPAPLDTTLPSWSRFDDVVEILYGPDEIGAAVVSAHIARQRGQADALDGHAMLTRCKVAAVLAIMHGRSVVSEWDWQRSADVMTVSDQTREWIVGEAQKAARAKVRQRAIARADGEEFVSDRKLQRAKSAVIRWLGRDQELAANQLRSKLKADLRDHFGAAVAELVAEAVIVEIQVDRGTRYRLAPEVQGVPPVQGASPQLNDGVPEVQGVPGDGPRASITDIESRRSHESARPALSCQKWLDQHITALRAQGHTTAESFAVYEAGEAAGYKRGSIAQAASAHPDVIVVNQSSAGNTWSLTGEHREYVTAGEWFDKYLDRLPQGADDIDQAAFRHAATAAGYSWDAARHAALRSGRIESIPAHGNAKAQRIWRIVTDTDGVGA
ncbi:MAG: hypothetical protein HZB45_15190 [Mycolicibacterium rufum]|nr:hypothetical protein [Mycolicibacterium rufum]